MDSQCASGQTFSRRKMVQDIYSSRMYVWIRRIVLVSHGVASSVCWNSYSSRTYVRIRRMVLVSLCGVSDLFNIMLDYSNGVWLQGMMQLILSDDMIAMETVCL
jgi:hypothetical protein